MDFVATRWNWKAALVSALLRGTIFFSAAVEFGLPAALNALIVDAMFRVPMAGMCAAVIQELRSAEPPWAAAATAVLGVPAASHAIEITVHRAAMTPGFWRGVTFSIGLSMMSSAVQLVLMRRGLMLVGPEASRSR